MLRLEYVLAVLLFMSVMASSARAVPLVSIEPALPESGWSPAAACSSGFAEDDLTLRVSEKGKQVASTNFCSSYGKAKAHVITDKTGQTFILLEYSEGRGPNATTGYLALERLPDLLEVLRIPLSWATGPAERFTYSYVTELPASGGVRIILKGRNSGLRPSRPGLECCVPRASYRTIDVSN